jgi:thiol-disulfide isomerase/thioredoxin
MSCRKAAKPDPATTPPSPQTATVPTGAKESEPAKPTRLADGTIAPDFILKTLNGANGSLSQHKGKVILLDFWAAWCPPCRESIPLIDKLQEVFAGKDLAILCICTASKQEELEAYLKEQPDLNLTILVDPAEKEKSVGFSQYLINGFPTYFLIGKDGRIVRSFMGFSDDNNLDTLKIQILQQLGKE